MRSGKRRRVGPMDVFLAPSAGRRPRVGFIVPRHGHSAVERNRLRRRLREIARREWLPLAWEAFQDYRMGGAFLTRIDREVFALVTGGQPEAATKKAEELGILSWGEKGIRRNRERAELEAKLTDFGLPIPWADQD